MSTLFWELLTKVSIIIVISYLFSNSRVFSKTLNSENFHFKEKILMSLYFGAIGIIGTYSGIPYMGAIVNNRVIGVVIGGLIGGPVVGVLSGLIAGGHRFLIDIGGFTAFSCGLSTLTEGLVAGLLSPIFYKSDIKVAFAFVVGLVTEFLQMVIIILTARPVEDAFALVEIIAFPMIVINSVGIAIIIAIIENIKKQNDAQAAFRAQMALKIANKTLPYLSKGLTVAAAEQTTRIIHEVAKVDAIAITDNKRILAHYGASSDHHLTNDLIHTTLTKEVLKTGTYKIALDKSEIGCDRRDCTLQAAVIAPLKINNQTIGTLKFYNAKKSEIRQVDLELVLGLASLFSTQLELSKLENQTKLLAMTELKALQAQINPHFLFNALNTINSLVRIDPDNARRQLVNLADYFRHNLTLMEEEVTLEKELNQVKSYLEIEKARYQDNLEIEYHIDADLGIRVPPIIVQPLVENSIKHGIFSLRERGKIIITFKENTDTLMIEVSDNGIGMNPDTIEKLLADNYSKTSVGIINTHKRLKTIYGEHHGLKIMSKPYQGTTVRIEIPLGDKIYA
ncbi:MAG: histidine kinase [delta proteobacterium ML8_F1]|nr:MAG: histidine kinase [delta proteobacterium ML8_F1]